MIKHIILVSFFFPCFILAQAKYAVEITVIGESNEWVPDFKNDVTYDSISITQELASSIKDLRNNNYLLANIDSINFDSTLCKVNLFIGEKYQFDALVYDEKADQIIKSSGVNRIILKHKKIDTSSIQNQLKPVLKYLYNNGHPFAKLEIGNTTISDNKIATQLSIDKNDFITYDTLKMYDLSPISHNFIARYLNLRQGRPYSHKDVLKIQKKIKDLGFLKLSQDPEVKFIKNLASISLPIVSNKSSSFDFLIGILPTNENGVRKINVNGELSADLNNRFGQGERISFQLRRLSAEDQLLSIKASYPYLLDLPIGLDGLFELRRNRNISIDLNTNFGGQYIFSGLNALKAFANYKTSSIINIDTTTIISTNKLPNNLDFKYRGGGIEYTQNNLNYKFNPSRGWSISTEVNLGLRSIIKNQSILNIKSNELNFENAYDSLKINSFQANVALSIQSFIPIKSFGTIKIGMNSGIKYNDGRVLENELFRIGGNKLLRGFDELSILSNYYVVLSTEFRLLLDTDSYLSFPFIDLSRMQTFVEGEPIIDNAYGIGLGLNFSTKAGIFNVSFAAGSRLSNPIDFSNTKVHFGYINLF